MTDLEQQMKAALDGRFWSFTHDGQVRCRTVGEGFVQQIPDQTQRKIEEKIGGKKSAQMRADRIEWSKEDTDYVRANMDRKTPTQIARHLRISYQRAYYKMQALRWLRCHARKK